MKNTAEVIAGDNVSVEILFNSERNTQDRDTMVQSLLETDHPQLSDEQINLATGE